MIGPGERGPRDARPEPRRQPPGPGRRVLVLGGTAEARELADRLAATPDVEVVTSLAGRTRDPRLPAGAVRTGGFGGVDGLAAVLRPPGGGPRGVDVLVDATHPFAAAMTAHAAAAATRTGVPLVVLRRPGWTEGPDDRWRRVPTVAAAAGAVAPDARVLLTVGRQEVGAFASADAWFLVRAVEPPDPADLPRRHELLLARGPFALADERALLARHRIDLVVAKDSGGVTDAKLTAARERAVPVVLVDRSPLPILPPRSAVLATVDEVVAQVAALVP